jgi:predicted nucleic acid-binding protein
MRIVLDSNILVRAAWKADGLASQLLRSVLEGPHRLIVSPFILGEVARVLAYPRIAQYCTRRGIRIMDDIQLYGILGPRLPSHPARLP